VNQIFTSTQREWSGRGWSANFDGNDLRVVCGKTTHIVTTSEVSGLRVTGIMFRTLELNGKKLLRIKGVSRNIAQELALFPQVVSALVWESNSSNIILQHERNGRWIDCETVEQLRISKPNNTLVKELQRTNSGRSLDHAQHSALVSAMEDLPSRVRKVNARILKSEQEQLAEFFGSIENQPLTCEQIEAVVCFDNRVQVVAAAGSGKTSVMVARAAYAVKKGFTDPSNILLLAFNKSAAVELRERVNRRFRAAGLDPTKIKISTFHAFGLEVLGNASGKKPRLAAWLDGVDGDLHEVTRIVEELKVGNREFAYHWDFFRLLFASSGDNETDNEADAYDQRTRETGFRTLDGKIVRSFGEKLIADCLYLHGVKFEYERPYKYDTATRDKSQYRPDFYYPQIDLWHEHTAIDSKGDVLPSLDNYEESLQWKRETHKLNKTELYESTYHDVVHGDGLDRLLNELQSRGVHLRFDPSKAPVDLSVRDEDLVRTIRTFMTHIKSSGLSREALEERLNTKWHRLRTKRSRRFIELYWPIHDAWERRLKSENLVDYDDMVILAAEALESRAYTHTYSLVLVDEFQDVSHARARMTRALVERTKSYLLAVGDDWQSINRFAGADAGIMNHFTDWFGTSQNLQLTTTFRCPQSICDVTSLFVGKNPNQLAKSVRSAKQKYGTKVQIKHVDDSEIGLREYLKDLSKRVGMVRGNRRPTVLVLGRYTFDRRIMPSEPPDNLDVSFRTIHSAKGLEADFVVILRVVTGRYGFPSRIKDDPILALVAAESDNFRHAEERRVLYVAMTRARYQVTLLSESGKESEFIAELLSDGLCETDSTTSDGNPKVCAACKRGTLVKRKGPYGAFYGCSRFPACTGK